MAQSRWDEYFHNLCKVNAGMSRCLSRQIGVVLVRNRRVIATGYNGPPTGAFHCGKERVKNDPELFNAFRDENIPESMWDDHCPRKLLEFQSGYGMHLCPAAHAEANALVNAARMGVAVEGAELYMNSMIPCRECMKLVINAGISEIIIEEVRYYDKRTPYLVRNARLSIRKFTHLC